MTTEIQRAKKDRIAEMHNPFCADGEYKYYGVLCGPDTSKIDHAASPIYTDYFVDSMTYARWYVRTNGGWAEIYHPETNIHVCYV